MPDEGLSVGALVGIIVGSVVGVALIAGVIFMLTKKGPEIEYVSLTAHEEHTIQ
jgi:hypothetical protein